MHGYSGPLGIACELREEIGLLELIHNLGEECGLLTCSLFFFFFFYQHAPNPKGSGSNYTCLTLDESSELILRGKSLGITSCRRGSSLGGEYIQSVRSL